jgi:hypothetical protein
VALCEHENAPEQSQCSKTKRLNAGPKRAAKDKTIEAVVPGQRINILAGQFLLPLWPLTRFQMDGFARLGVHSGLSPIS